MKKYAITQEKMEVDGHHLFRIMALVNIARHDIKKGQLGGYIESEANLSQKDDAWIDERACVFGEASVSDNALVYGDAIIKDYATVSGDAKVGGRTEVYENAKVSGNANIHNEVCIAKDSGTCGILNYAHRDADWEAVNSHIIICGEAKVFGNVNITDNVIIGGTAKVSRGKIYGNATILAGYKRGVGNSTILPAIIYNAEEKKCYAHDIPMDDNTIITMVPKGLLTDAAAAAV